MSKLLNEDGGALLQESGSFILLEQTTEESNIKPREGKMVNTSPTNNVAREPTFVYLENFTITKGQPLPWGLNWALTYAATLTFIAQRK